MIETRVIHGEIKLEWDDLRSQDEREGLWVLEARETPIGIEINEQFESIDITHHRYEGIAYVYYNETGDVTGIGHFKIPEDKNSGYVPLIEQAFLRKFIIKKLDFIKITGARVNWIEKYISEYGTTANREVGKVWIGTMIPQNYKKTNWYRTLGIEHELVGEKLANALSDFNFLKSPTS